MDVLDVVYFMTPGTRILLDHDALLVEVPGCQGKTRVPLLRVESIVATGGVWLSPETMRRCVDLGIHVTWISQNGKLIASIAGQQGGRGELRLAQCRAHDNIDQRLELCRLFVAGKLQNCRQVLLRAARDASGKRQVDLRQAATAHASALESLPHAMSITEVLGIEGRAARVYFESSPHLYLRGAPVGRTRRPPTDPVNCYLSMGYALLRSAVHAACVHSGLDPYIGFLHGVRGTKPALALDLMEEFRPLLVDRLVMSLVNRGQLVGDRDTRTLPGGAVEFTTEGRGRFMVSWAESRAKVWRHGGLNRSVSAAELPILQARQLARHLREPEFPYRPWSLV